MSKFLLDLRASQVVSRIRVRKLAIKAKMNAAANAIANTANADLIPAVYPTRITHTLAASAELPREGAQIAAVRLRVTDELFNIYEYGARAHPIYPQNGTALHFVWQALGQEVFFHHVNHPGFEGRHRLSALEESIINECRDLWYAAMQEALFA